MRLKNCNGVLVDTYFSVCTSIKGNVLNIPNEEFIPGPKFVLYLPTYISLFCHLITGIVNKMLQNIINNLNFNYIEN